MNMFRLYLVANYSIVQVLALVVGTQLWNKDVRLPEDIARTLEAVGAGRNTTPLVLVGLILIVSLALLLLIKYGLSYLLYYFTEYGLLFVLISFIVYSLYDNTYFSFLVAGIAAGARYAVPQFKHVSVIIFAAGVAAILGSLEIYYVIVFLVLLSLYDIVAVRKTKHMQTIAEDVREKESSLLFTLDTKEEIFVLGSADIILPSILVVSVFLHYSLMETLSEGETLVFPILGALLCSLLALAGLFIATRQREAPALPYASLGILGFFIIELIRFL